MMPKPDSGDSLIAKIGSYLQIVTKDPNSTIFVPLAKAYSQIGLLDDALEAALLGTKTIPNYSPGFAVLGNIYCQMGRLEEALKAYNQALLIDPENLPAFLGLAKFYIAQGERDRAIKTLAQAKGFHPDNSDVMAMLNALALPRPWEQIKQATEVHDDFAHQVFDAAESEDPIPTATLAEIYVKQGLIEQAIKIYQDILKKDPRNAAVLQRIEVLSQSDEDKQGPGQVDAAINSTPLDNQSPLMTLQRWLSAIQLRKKNV
jgi:tetratricopeptide (TPR) repeat protein